MYIYFFDLHCQKKRRRHGGVCSIIKILTIYTNNNVLATIFLYLNYNL